jgi:PLP dependent protein
LELLMGCVDKLLEIKAIIAREERDWQRSAGSTALIAVSKLFGAEVIAPVLEAGQRVFGENYVQEAMTKWPDLRGRFAGVELHMIGPLQSNKAREAIQTFDVIQTLDRDSLAKALAKEIDKQGKRPRLFVQVNTGEEPQKGGVLPSELDSFMASLRQTYHLPVEGLMCIPPADQPPSPHFAFLKKLADAHGLAGLSMGMSADFEQAIRLGATHVRVGSAIFGARG